MKINKKVLLPAILSISILFAAVAAVSVGAKEEGSWNGKVIDIPEAIPLNGSVPEVVGLYNYRGKIQGIWMPEYGGYGPPSDWIDANVVITLYGSHKRFGFQLRNDGYLPVHQGWLDIARDAFRDNRTVSIDFWNDPAKNTGMILRIGEFRS